MACSEVSVYVGKPLYYGHFLVHVHVNLNLQVYTPYRKQLKEAETMY